MPTFLCTRCGAIENTATSDYFEKLKEKIAYVENLGGNDTHVKSSWTALDELNAIAQKRE